MLKLLNTRSLTDFQRNTNEHLRRLKKSGDPEVLTVNGEAELVVGNSVFSMGFVGSLGAGVNTFMGGEVTQVTAIVHEGRTRSPAI